MKSAIRPSLIANGTWDSAARRAHRRRNKPLARRMIIVERTHAIRIASTEQRPLAWVMNDEREIAFQVVDAFAHPSEDTRRGSVRRRRLTCRRPNVPQPSCRTQFVPVVQRCIRGDSTTRCRMPDRRRAEVRLDDACIVDVEGRGSHKSATITTCHGSMITGQRSSPRTPMCPTTSLLRHSTIAPGISRRSSSTMASGPCGTRVPGARNSTSPACRRRRLFLAQDNALVRDRCRPGCR